MALWSIVESTPDGASISSVTEADEFGNVRTSSQVGADEYGWLSGAKSCGSWEATRDI
jgi:hypothetical protein